MVLLDLSDAGLTFGLRIECSFCASRQFFIYTQTPPPLVFLFEQKLLSALKNWYPSICSELLLISLFNHVSVIRHMSGFRRLRSICRFDRPSFFLTDRALSRRIDGMTGSHASTFWFFTYNVRFRIFMSFLSTSLESINSLLFLSSFFSISLSSFVRSGEL